MPTVRVSELPSWVDAARLLGPGEWSLSLRPDGRRLAQAELGVREAADLDARLRGVGLDGRALEVSVEPKLPRAAVRGARGEEARRRRNTTPGFERKGALLDPEGKISLTPETLADAIARRANRRSVIDATAGCGGNTLAFARAGSRVVAIDDDPRRLEMARHNARLYGVEDRILFVAGDARDIVPKASAWLDGDAILFVDPPWGAEWDRTRTRLDDLPLLAALRVLAPAANVEELWAKVPPSFEVATFPGAAAEAHFGAAPGDFRRVKFVLLRAAVSRIDRRRAADEGPRAGSEREPPLARGGRPSRASAGARRGRADRT